MIKLRLAVVAVVAGILVMSTGSLAHAATNPYPVGTPAPTPSIAPDDDSLGPDDEAIGADDNGILPSTGGIGIYVVLAGGILLVAGGAAVYASRQRQQTSR